MKKGFKHKLALMGASVLLPLMASAQVKSGTDLLSDIEGKIRDTGTRAINVVSLVLGLAAVVMLIAIVIESYKPNSQSKDGLVKWFVVTIVVFVALEIIKAAFF